MVTRACPACAGHVAPGKVCWKCGRTGCEACGGKPAPGSRCVDCGTTGHYAAPPRSTFSAEHVPHGPAGLPVGLAAALVPLPDTEPPPARPPELVFVVKFNCTSCGGVQQIRCQGMDRQRVEVFACLTTARDAAGDPWPGYVHTPLGHEASALGRCGLCHEQTLRWTITEGEQ